MFTVKCPYCRCNFRAEGSHKVTCRECGGIYKVEIRETLPHQKEDFGDVKERAYVKPIKGRKRT